MAINEKFDKSSVSNNGETDSDDFSAIRAADHFFTALGAGNLPESTDQQEAELAELLLRWRDNAYCGDLPAGPSELEIRKAIKSDRDLSQAGVLSPSKRAHHLRMATGFAAAMAILAGSLSVAAHSAEPGDPLWAVNKTVFTEHAGEVELIAVLSENLEKAEKSAEKGDLGAAEKLLRQVSNRLDEVDSAMDRSTLLKRRDVIERRIKRVATDSNSAGAEGLNAPSVAVVAVPPFGIELTETPVIAPPTSLVEPLISLLIPSDVVLTAAPVQTLTTTTPALTAPATTTPAGGPTSTTGTQGTLAPIPTGTPPADGTPNPPVTSSPVKTTTPPTGVPTTAPDAPPGAASNR